MIKESTPLSLAEVKEILESKEEKEIINYVKKFCKTKASLAHKIRAEIQKLENIKIKEEHIVKIVDLMPEDSQDINKIFVDASLDENEIKSILEIIKKSK
ncbi:MAG: hypothetical protein ABIH72_01380 [archaeon]